MKVSMLMLVAPALTGVIAANPDTAGNDQPGVTFSFIRENLQLGQNTDEVLGVLGDDFTRVVSMMVDAQVWRYDFPSEPGYTYSCPSGEDCVDVEGLGGGRMAMQLFVTWNESGFVGDYTLYIGSTVGTVNEYRVFPDGTVRKSRIDDGRI